MPATFAACDRPHRCKGDRGDSRLRQHKFVTPECPTAESAVRAAPTRSRPTRAHRRANRLAGLYPGVPAIAWQATPRGSGTIVRVSRCTKRPSAQSISSRLPWRRSVMPFAAQSAQAREGRHIRTHAQPAMQPVCRPRFQRRAPAAACRGTPACAAVPATSFQQRGLAGPRCVRPGRPCCAR